MGWDWLWQGLLTTWLSSLLALAGAAVVAFLRSRGSRLTRPILYGLCTFVLVIVAGYCFQGYRYFASQPTPLNESNLEPTIRRWLDAFHKSVTNISDPDSNFALIVAGQNGNVTVRRTKQYERYVTLQAGIVVSAEHMAILTKLPQDKRRLMMQEVVLELARQKIIFSYSGSPEIPIQRITLEKRLPITSALTEDAFMTGLDEMDFALVVTRGTIVTEIERATMKR